MRHRVLTVVAPAAVALAVSASASASAMHPRLAAKLSGMGSTGRSTSSSRRGRARSLVV
jgi:hypothetical protein